MGSGFLLWLLRTLGLFESTVSLVGALGLESFSMNYLYVKLGFVFIIIEPKVYI